MTYGIGRRHRLPEASIAVPQTQVVHSDLCLSNDSSTHYTPPYTPRQLYDIIIASIPSPQTENIASFQTSPTPSTDDGDTWMTGNYDSGSAPSIRVENTDFPYQFSYPDSTDQFFDTGDAFQDHYWSMYQAPSTDFQSASSQSPNFGQQYQRGHKRQTSDSTIASNGPDSPYTHGSSFPHIVNFDTSPTTSYGTDEFGGGFYSAKPRSADSFEPFPVGYLPSQLSHTWNAQSAFRDMSLDQQGSAEEVPDFASSRQSTSTQGRNTPATPRTVHRDDSDDKSKAQQNEFRQGPRVELYRTESAACQDELYNPANFTKSPAQRTSTSQQQPSNSNDLLTPHRNLVNEVIKTANSVRSQSPSSDAQRPTSPFRRGSPLAPSEEFRSSSGPVLGSAEQSRRQQRERASAQEFARHQPALRREVTKTMSPKDAVLDYTENDQDAPLFNDTLPKGYQRHSGTGTESFANNFVSGTNQAFGQFAPRSQHNLGGFRSADGTVAPSSSFAFMPSNQQSQNSTFPQPTGQFRSINASSTSDQTPEFPAHLTSMESSMSDNPPVSSQESARSPIQRPAKTSADTGTYTCTYHGCSQRFESPAKLQRHKRESHQQQHQQAQQQAFDNHFLAPPTSPSAASHTSSDGDENDSTGSAGMTSAALLARNSQAGPHKCTRINPSTGKPCNTIFSRPYDLTRHEDTIHNRQKQKVRCQFCREDKTFSRNDALTRHMRVVHPEVDFQGKRGRRDF